MGGIVWTLENEEVGPGINPRTAIVRRRSTDRSSQLRGLSDSLPFFMRESAKILI